MLISDMNVCGGVVEIDRGDDRYCDVDLFLWLPKGTYRRMNTPSAFKTVYHENVVYTHTATEDNYRDLRHELVKFWFEDGAEMIEVYVREVFVMDRRHVSIYCESFLDKPYVATKDGKLYIE